MNKGNNYDKIKHLVEVDDDILAVFIVMSSQIKELYIAKNSNMNRGYVDSIVNELNLQNSIENEKLTTENAKLEGKGKSILGKIKWIVLEYDNLRILKIFENDKIIFVLINSNTQLEHTVDNILGYYYDLDEIPKSLF
ncbi:MAG TPA: hypothetical protein VLE21_00530 [Candidatus Nitrosocosmicus sp.]|nr:hypothetical protein [Candidatus Nitrosocosmicus sp.]